MGDLLRTFTYPRNAFGSSPQRSAEKALAVLDRVSSGKLHRAEDGSIKDEPFNDARLFLATVSGQPNAPQVTTVGEKFRSLASQSEVSAWRWLLTRSMWLYSVPNGSQVRANNGARRLGITFNVFDMILRATVHFSALPEPDNIMYFDELIVVLDDDQNWGLTGFDLFKRVLAVREQSPHKPPDEHAELLSDLEPQYGVGRDYFNTVFRKAFGQCGLFTLTGSENRILGIKLDPATYENPVLAERLRFVLDHPRQYTLQDS